MSTVPFKLITPTQIIFQGDAELIIAVGTEGEEGILPRHAAFLTSLKPGVLRANVVDGDKNSRLELATGDGFMQAFPDRVTVLVDRALRFEDVNVGEAREELDAAVDRQRLGGADSTAYVREQNNIDFANAKLRLTGHR
ncbi:MAG: ATP synthase F1 subunit epsilon [Candidatus Eremiobacteraeota bacterium]|nr:ATP synthase F1 subunit epsilon [Candidatus Eremiobacteraeota bacterium]